MRTPPMVAEPYPAQKRPWLHYCHTCGQKMARNLDDGGIHCPVCRPKSYDGLTDA